MTPLVILGAGGHAREIADVVRACIDAGAALELLGFVDDDASMHGRELHENTRYGPIPNADDLPGVAFTDQQAAILEWHQPPWRLQIRGDCLGPRLAARLHGAG